MRLFFALILLATPAFAGLGSYPEQTGNHWSNLEGVYAAIGGGPALLIAGDNAFALDGEARLGYAFGAQTQVYLSGSIDNASVNGASFRLGFVGANLQYHLAVRPAVMVYARGGIGLGIGGPLDPATGGYGLGLAGGGGLGMEIRLADQLFLAPELFYRNSNVSTSGYTASIQVVGLSLNLVYY